MEISFMPREGQTVFIVGGSSGIGLAAACQLAADGANVAIFARRPEVLERARQEIVAHQKEPSSSVSAYSLDAADFAQTQEVFARAAGDLGKPSVLINSAGGSTPHRFIDMDADQLDRTLRSNVAPCWNACKAVVPYMMERDAGTIVNVSSLAGLIGVYGYTDYCLAKYGVVGFSEALRSELKPNGIKVQVFCPPDTQTPGYDEENKTKPVETIALSAGANLMSAADVADALVDGLSSNKFVVLANRESRLFWALQRYAPGLGRIYIDHVIAKAQAKK